ncbi:hypothetical protein PILCRDRAFT_812055 [Piloderma croceum F 1598]|uniref:Uncharacterized protein n=1 Tax=Piloderma croceum (strain F 1598) TaxID=765440 RepID=A0A0C3CKW2_PILCF|nr:hypothetical protein PILCRDRAFT_812055 [Piloderma croceum F 1598]
MQMQGDSHPCHWEGAAQNGTYVLPSESLSSGGARYRTSASIIGLYPAQANRYRMLLAVPSTR